MDNAHIQQLLAELSPEEQQDFQTLLDDLVAVGGDINKLPASDKARLASLASRHQQQPEQESAASPEELTASEVVDEVAATAVDAPEQSPIQSDFGQYVVDQVKTLCEGGSSLADAIRYAYHNKYLPVALRDDQVCKDLLQRYQQDILDLAHSFKSLESAHLADAKLLVGFAWFAMIFQCYQYVEAYGELH